jgi:hypothetical protein
MTFATGILIWIAMGLGAALLFRALYRGPTTTLFLALCFGTFGALIGGMLGVSAYVTHDPAPLRFGGLLGALLGGVLFSFVYNVVAKKAL